VTLKSRAISAIASPRSNRSAAPSLTRSRAACSSGVYPPACAYLIVPAYRKDHEPSATNQTLLFQPEYAGSCETSADGSEAESAVLVFRTAVGGNELHGIDLLHFDEDGLIKEFTAMVRPQSAAEALGRAVVEGLIADGLVPAPASAAE